MRFLYFKNFHLFLFVQWVQNVLNIFLLQLCKESSFFEDVGLILSHTCLDVRRHFTVQYDGQESVLVLIPDTHNKL